MEIYLLVKDDFNYSVNGINGIRAEAITAVLGLYSGLDGGDKYYIIRAVKSIGAKISEIKHHASTKHTLG